MNVRAVLPGKFLLANHFVLAIIVAVLLVFPQLAMATSPIDVGLNENGDKTTGQAEIWHDPDSDHSVTEVAAIYGRGEFKPLPGAGSTGLKPGAFWTHFALRNTSDEALTLNIEYIDHQLVALQAFQKMPGVERSTEQQYRPIANMALTDPFDLRPISHNRFVFSVTIPPGGTSELLVKLSAHQAGFFFPSMRIWSPENLRKTYIAETCVVMILFGGILLMTIISLVGALATRDRTFWAYAVYALTKIISWCTILGYTHQFIVKDHFHFNYLSVSAALGVLCGTIFSRAFLQTRVYTPKLDYVFIFMMGNAVFMLICALFSFTELAVISITVALLLYPMMSIAGIVRWRQGSTDAAVYALAWSLLVFGLVVQALRDLGFVQHNTINYYWPALASFVEMLGILAAMGIKIYRLRTQKDEAEHRYMVHLQESKAKLEQQVRQRTQELEEAKLAAEHEARTDPLTGLYNRRSFFTEAGKCLNLALRKNRPLSLLMFDLDYFKSINDKFGHSMGDEALKQFGYTIASNLRDSDVLGRIGGEEFALVLNEDQPSTLQTARRLTEQVASIMIDTPDGELRLTTSVGVAYFEGESDIAALLGKADNALYQAKNQGRNRIIEHNDDPQ